MQIRDTTLWGEVDDFEEEEEDDEEEAQRGDGTATPMLGTATPLVGSGSATPVVSGGVHSISGISSITSGMDTPGTGTRSKKGGIASVSGISSASLTPTPQLFQVLEEQKSRSAKKGAPTPVGGADTPGPVTMNLNPEQDCCWGQWLLHWLVGHKTWELEIHAKLRNNKEQQGGSFRDEGSGGNCLVRCFHCATGSRWKNALKSLPLP
eukprot:Skav204314  [mRNA]  locus=scaffold660:14285:24559:+ [translate_table: standard]